MNATRFPLQPLPQPVYRFADIPSAARNLEGSTLHRITDRLVWQQCLGEMVLLCKEAASRWNRKRQAQQSADCGAHKPLSLEYLADRSDVDEPLWGYMVRDKTQGRLQGFVTVTTFTNYHRHFRWDSQHPAAFDDEDDAQEGDQEQEGTPKKKKLAQDSTSQRAVDTNGRLAAELQATCRAGDVWQEGIVWPRIAEISLLGALGCGQVLIDLVLEDLARLKSTSSAHYDYVVLQATDNSITFYENRGFIRVGALSTEMVSSAATASAWGSPRRHRRGAKQDAVVDDGNDNLVVDWGSPSKQSKDEQLSDWIVAPAWDTYKTKKVGETPLKIAQSLRINAHDICFLNQREYPELQVSSRLKAETVLTVPKVVATENSRARPSVEMEWFTAKENDTPRSIAKMTGVPCAQIVAANKARLPGLVSSARLKQGTKVRIVKQEDGGCCWQAYSHWAFPDDDSFEAGEPSYMMAIKLDKPARGKISHRPILESLASEITPFEKPSLLVDVAGSSAASAASIDTLALHSTPPPAHLLPLPKISAAIAASTPAIAESPEAPPVQDSLVTETIPPPPVPPKKPQGSWIIYCHEMRERKAALLKGKNASETTRIFKDAYDLLTDADKQVYTKKAALQRQAYLPLKAAYDQELAAYQARYPQAVIPVQQSTTPSKTHSSSKRTSDLFDHRSTDFFNKVVRLRPGAPRADGTDLDKYTYWYVLTFIPDLQWCHLGPMRVVGTFGSDKPKAEGRPRYKLEDEALGLEVDISSTYCIPVKSRGMRKTNDADKEEWDIRDDGTEPGSFSISRRCSLESNASVASSFRSASKPSAVVKDRKRKRPVESSGSSTTTSSSVQQLPSLEAVHPDTQRVMRVFVRQRGPGRPPKAPKILRETIAVEPVVAPPPRSSSHSSSTTTETVEEDSALSEDDDNVKDNADADDDALSATSIVAKPKRLAAPTFLGESPGSPRLRQRQQPARGKQPIIY